MLELAKELVSKTVERQTHLGISENSWKIAFNTRYLMEFLALQSSKQKESRVTWRFGTKLSQSLLAFEGEEKLFSYVLVPLK